MILLSNKIPQKTTNTLNLSLDKFIIKEPNKKRRKR